MPAPDPNRESETPDPRPPVPPAVPRSEALEAELAMLEALLPAESRPAPVLPPTDETTPAGADDPTAPPPSTGGAA